MFEHNTYTNDIQSFHKVSSLEAKDLLSTQNLVIIYIGRETCPFCQKFVRKLSGLVSQINHPIYYIDTQDASDTEISTFREEYNVITVPGFIVKKAGHTTVRCDSSMPEDEILGLMS